MCGQTGCDVEWPFDEVRKMALLTPEEMEYFEKKLFSNAAKNYLEVKEVSSLSTVCHHKPQIIEHVCEFENISPRFALHSVLVADLAC